MTILQIELAIELNKPLFVHERDAHEDLLQILDEFKGKLPPILVHCFTGSSEHALAYLEKGFYIGLTGSTFKIRQKRHVNNGMLIFQVTYVKINQIQGYENF